MNRLSPTKTNNTTVQPVTQTQSDTPSSTNTQEYFIGEDVTFSTSNMANDTTPNNSSTSMTQNDAVLHGLEQHLQQEESGDESDDLELTDEYLAQHGGLKTEEKPPAKMEEKPSMGGDDDDDDGDDGSSSGDDDSTSSDEEDKDNKDMDGEDSTNDNSYQDEYEEEKTNVKTRANKKKKKKPTKRNAKADNNDDTKELVAAATRKSKRSRKGSEPQRFRDADYVNGSIKAAPPVSSSKRAAIPNSAKGSKGVLCSDLANGNMSGNIIMEPGNAILPMTQLQSSYSMLAIHNLMSVVTNPEHLAPHSLWSIPSDVPPSDCCIMKPSKPSVHIKKKKSSKQSKKIANHGPKTLLNILYTNLLKMYEHDRTRYLACRYDVNMHACTFIHENMQVIEDEAFHSSFIFLYSFLVSEACFNNVGIDQISDHMYRYINSNSSEDICSRVRTIESELEAIKNMRR